MSFSYAFFLLEEHPFGRQMLSRLMEAGLPPAVVVEERSELAARKGVRYEQLLAGRLSPPRVSDLRELGHFSYHCVDNHNHDVSRSILRELQPELLVLGNTRILRPEVFSLARKACLNVHPGLLPEIKGSFPVAWSILNDVPLGCTCHVVDASVDTGDIISRKEISVEPSDNLASLVAKSVKLSADLMVDAVRCCLAGTLTSKAQDLSQGQCFRWPCDETVRQAEEKLRSGQYRPVAKGSPNGVNLTKRGSLI